MFYALVSIMLSALAAFSILFAKRKGWEYLTRIIKISTVVFIVLSMLNLFLPDFFARSHEPAFLEILEGYELYAILRWMNLASFIVLPMAVFQKNKYFVKIAIFFCLPITIINAAYFFKHITLFTIAAPPSGLLNSKILPTVIKDVLVNKNFRTIFFALLCVAQLLPLVLLTVENRRKLAVAKKDIVNLILIFLGTIYLALPVYVPQILFGHVDIYMKRFTLVHFGWLAIMAALAVAFYFVFRHKSHTAKYEFLLAVSWSLMMQFSQMFTATGQLGIAKLPLQLCNVASYLALLTLLKKSQKLYHFMLIVNIVGALLAIFIMDISPSSSHLTRLWVVHFIVEHTKVLLVPIWCLIFGIFKPLSLKQSIKHFSIGFTAYFVFVFILGTISNGIYRMQEGLPTQDFFYSNHLFMFDKDTARELVGFSDPLFEIGLIRFGTFEIYPLMQVLVYIVFMTICLGMNLLLYALSYKQRKTAKIPTQDNEQNDVAIDCAAVAVQNE